MSDSLLRTRMLIGDEKLKKLKESTVLIFGLGGVGGFAAEAIARSGVGHIILVDNDVVDITNINRQIIALNSTVGQYKTDVMERRIKDINPEAVVEKHTVFYLPPNDDIIKSGIDYIAVSYTHLDVYKRQGLWSPLDRVLHKGHSYRTYRL